MSTTDITVPMQRGSAEATLFLKTRIATINLQRMSGSITLRLQKNLVGDSFIFETGGWFDNYFDLWYDKQGVVGSSTGIILTLQGDK